MVKFEINTFDGKHKVRIIDDAEGTPGSSRQYTRFNAEVLLDLNTMLETSEKPFTEIVDVLKKHNFVIKDHKFKINNVHGERYTTNTYKIETKE